MISHARSSSGSGEVPRRRGWSARQLGVSIALLLFTTITLLLLSASTTSLGVTAANSRPALFRSPASDNSRGADFLQQVLTKPRSSLAPAAPALGAEPICRPTGQIEDASCDYETVETINSQFFDRLDTLRKTDFFKFYKVNLFKECPYWNENGFCMNRACSVETEDESDVPEEFRVNRLSSVTTASPNDVVMTGSDASCSCSSTEFCHLDDESSEEGVYVDLLKNPERFTGYAGPSANRVWKSIYEENCFNGVKFVEPARPTSSGGTGFVDKSMLQSSSPALGGLSSGFSGLMSSLQAPLDSGDSEQCLEKRVFYRIISGLHASISIHICHDFLDTQTGQWAPNLECFITRIAEHPERLQNVYFDYVLLLRALSRLGDSTHNFSLRAGDSIEDPLAVAQLDRLISDARACPTTFDEAQMFSAQNRESLELKQEFRQHFRNISTIMDCVGCDKCRLWGKLQVNGIGTALKLLFNRNEREVGEVRLQKSELVALVNAAHRIAESLRAVERFRDMYQEQRLEVAKAEQVEDRVSSGNATQQERDGVEADTNLGESRLSHWLHWLERQAQACRRSLVHCLHALGVVTGWSSGRDASKHSEL
ncbi:related to endoplasmic oxidoreductin 1 precursor [Sporisorium reilianum SRZ2]|uniref:Related to endoplasmic oxidoreductin 1 n=1 Tax=Sporisorium reilianum (strain SRZ2) TaxID=999809 RepID=E6ZYW2_SPORE|nr:related to endoplasmic oxidoreductin 1 precursor [Sporisorium reilianum SRZ2]